MCRNYMSKVPEFWKVVQTMFFDQKMLIILDKIKVGAQKYKNK